MAKDNTTPETIKQGYLNGTLSAKDDFAFRKRLEEDPALREEMEILKAMQRIETGKFVKAMLSDVPAAADPAKSTIRPLPFYRQTWLRIAACLLVVLGIGWAVWQSRDHTGSRIFTVSIRQSADGSFGWAPGESLSRKITAILTPGSSIRRYSFYNDTLRVYLPETQLQENYSREGALYLVDDLVKRRLVLMLSGKKYEITDTREPLPLHETN